MGNYNVFWKIWWNKNASCVTCKKSKCSAITVLSWLSWERICLWCRSPGFDPWVGKILWRRKWQPTPVLLPGEFHARRSWPGYTVHGIAESDRTERLSLSLSRKPKAKVKREWPCERALMHMPYWHVNKDS